jgi:CAAX protease family protein
MNGNELVYAGLPRRLLAALIDNLTFLILYLWLFGGLVTALYDESPAAGFIAFFVYASVWFNYFIFMEWRTGQTVGKIAAEIQVRSLDGKERLTFGQASVRGLLRLVDFFAIGWLMITGSERKQRLGDRAAKTVVARKATETLTVRPAVRGAAPKSAATNTAAGSTAGSKPRGGRRLPEIPWDASDAGWGLAAGLILAVVVTPFLVLPFDPDLSSDGALLAAQALLGGSLLFVALGMASQWNFSALGEALARLGLQNFKWSGLGIALLTLFAYYVAVVLFASFVIEPNQEDIGGELGIGNENLLVAVTAVLLIVVLAPLSEEMFFRGFVFAGLRKRWSLLPAALIAGGIFGLIHAPTGITTVIPLAALGIALCWLYDRTGSLWPCVLAHVLNNGLALLVVS